MIEKSISKMGFNTYLKPVEPVDEYLPTDFISMPALFLAWMMVGLVLFLPVLDTHRVVLVPIALIPALSAVWSRQRLGVGVVWMPLVVGLLWGMGVVWCDTTVTPNLPAEMVRKKVMIQGVVADRLDQNGAVQLTLDAVESGAWRASGLVHVTIYRQRVTVLPGDRVALRVQLRQLSSFRNPGGFDYRAYLLEQGVIATGSSQEGVHKLATTDAWFWNRLRQRIADWIAVTLPDQRALAEALMVGKRGHLDGDLKDALFVSGTFHLVAISGLHMSLVGGGVYFLLRFLLVLLRPLSCRMDMKRPAALFSLLPLLVYAFLAGWSVSTQRAFIMVGLFLLAVVLQKRRQSWRILAIAAIVLLTLRPQQLVNVGFQLSFICVAVLLWCVEYVPAKGWKGRIVWLMTATLLLELVTLPISLSNFHRYSIYGVLVNPWAIPWVGQISTPLGLVALVLHGFWPAAADVMLHLMGWSLSLYQWVIETTLHLPGAWHRGAGVPLPGVALYLAAGSVAVAMRHQGLWGWRRLLFAGMALLALSWPRERTADHHWRLLVLDVGQALSMIVKMPAGGWSVVDAGGVATPRFNVGEGVISTVLWHYGVTRLERVVISHHQQDHMAGAAQLLRNFPVGALWMPRFTLEEEAKFATQELLHTAERLQVPLRFIDAPTEVQEGAGLWRVLPPLTVQSRANGNDRSLVLELEYQVQRILLTGDMEAKAESWLLSKQVVQPVTLLLVPHHGSLTSSTQAFVRATRPEHAIFSVGATNPWGFPKPAVVRRWQGVGAKIWRTDLDGAVNVLGDGTHLQITTGE